MDPNRLCNAVCVALLAFAACGPASAVPPREEHTSKQVIAMPRPAPSTTTVACPRPFEDKGVFKIKAGYSGDGASTGFIPPGVFLEIRRIKATLRAPGAYAANLGMNSGGAFAWYDLRMENGSAVFSASKDGALYADGGSRVKFVVYRNQGNDLEATGDYVVSGCLVDEIPLRLRRPDMQVPRLPPQTPARPGPVEKAVPVRTPRTGG
jgi:hypothetical protein